MTLLNKKVTLDEFRIKVALDTMILSYLVDKTYPNLNTFVEYLSQCNYVDIVVSKVVIYEFIGIRKLEHYLREIYAHTKKNNGKMNLSSAIKYRKDFNAPELPYKEVYSDVKRKVKADLKKISERFDVSFDDTILHKEIWEPQNDLVLSSKISKEDSLVLLSSVFPNEGAAEEYLVFLTNDGQFFDSFNDKVWENVVENFFNRYSLKKPFVYNLRKIGLLSSDRTINLINGSESKAEITKHAENFIFQHIENKNSRLLIGKTFKCECKPALRKRLLCFKLKKPLQNDIYISIIPNDLTFIYNHDTKLSGFRNVETIINYPYKPIPGNENKISVELLKSDGTLLPNEEMEKIVQKGNLVLLHPYFDS